MPWFPDFASAVELARRETRAAGKADPVAQYFAALNEGDTRTLETAWPGEVVIYDPRAGEVRGHKSVVQTGSWLRPASTTMSNPRTAPLTEPAPMAPEPEASIQAADINGKGAGIVDEKLEAIVIPVLDVDRAKEFYGNLGWRLDADRAAGDNFRIVQLTPPGSECSIQFGTNITSAAPGSVQDLYLIVSDIEAARAGLVARGVEVSEVFHEGAPGARFHHDDRNGRVSGPAPEHASYGSFVSFSDPDGNSWLFQEVTTRLPGRVDPAVTSFGSASDLADAMRRAAAAHGEHEKRIGEADANWPDWYAQYMVAEQAGTELPA